jgi:hypothetical protein
MADDWERTFSDSETEAIDAAIDDSDEDVRYSLRSRDVKKKQVVKVCALSDLAGATVDGGRAAASPPACFAASAASRPKSVATSTSARAYFQLPLRVASDASGRDRTSHDDRVTRNAVDANDELDFYPDPHPLLVGGQEPHAGRRDPKTRECETARAAEWSLWTGQNQTAGPRRAGQNSYRVLLCHDHDYDHIIYN